MLGYLNLEKVDAIGFSFGGDVLFQLALINPPLIRSMIAIGAVGSWSIEDFPMYTEQFIYDNRYSFPWLFIDHPSEEKIKALMREFKNYSVQLSNKELKEIRPEVMIVMGDDDEGMDLKEVVRLKDNLPKSDIWILPNVTHSAHLGVNKEDFILKATNFLKK